MNGVTQYIIEHMKVILMQCIRHSIVTSFFIFKYITPLVSINRIIQKSIHVVL